MLESTAWKPYLHSSTYLRYIAHIWQYPPPRTVRNLICSCLCRHDSYFWLARSKDQSYLVQTTGTFLSERWQKTTPTTKKQHTVSITGAFEWHIMEYPMSHLYVPLLHVIENTMDNILKEQQLRTRGKFGAIPRLYNGSPLFWLAGFF